MPSSINIIHNCVVSYTIEHPMALTTNMVVRASMDIGEAAWRGLRVPVPNVTVGIDGNGSMALLLQSE